MNCQSQSLASVANRLASRSAAVLLACSVFVAGCSDVGPSETEAEFWARMDAYVTERMDPSGSGFGFVVIHDDAIAFAKGWGMADIEAGLSFTQETPSYIASLTKQFTAVAVLILYERELLSLDAPIRSILPELPAEWADVTVHHLLIHQSGIPNYTDITGDDPADIDGLTNQAALDLVLQDPTLEFVPGTSTSYCNTGYNLLATAVERLSGTSFAGFLHDNIFQPLGMAASFVRDEALSFMPSTALPYDENNQLYEYTLFTYGAGGIYLTLNDYVKWDRALYTNDIVQQSTLELAFTGYTGGDNDFGYGWMVGTHSGSKSLRHGGFSTGYLNYALRVPGERFSYMFLSNGGVFANDGFDTWTSDLMDEILDRYL
jgi:CubicO group peptidase (beta-lactamase class C family)